MCCVVKQLLPCGCSHITPPCGGEGLGNELGSERCDWYAGELWSWAAGVMLSPCSGGPNGQEHCGMAASYWRLNAWVVGRWRCAEWSSGLQAVNAPCVASCP